MWKFIYNRVKKILKPYPGIKLFLIPLYRRTRAGYLRRRYPNGTFLTCHGAQVFCDFTNKNFSWYDGDSEYLKNELETFGSLLQMREPSVVLDIGAHWGLYPAYIANHPTASKINKVICVEPDANNARILSRTISNIKNMTVIQVDAAISNENGHVNLFTGGGSCGQTYKSSGSKQGERVRSTTLDSLIEAHLSENEVLTHIKLDIDGYEPAFFAGGLDSLNKYKPIIMMEFWAKGLKASGIDLVAYWEMLHRNYDVSEVSFPMRELLPMTKKDYSYLVDKTMTGVTNLVLVPKD